MGKRKQKNNLKTNKKGNEIKAALRPIFAVIFSVIAFAACSFAVLKASPQNDNSSEIAAEQKQTDIPYSKAPENKNICLVFDENDACILQLNFEDKRIQAVYVDEYNPDKNSYFGYTCDYTIHLSYETVCRIIDRVGALTLQTPEGEMRCTGVQVQQMLSETEDKREFKKQVILKIFEQICKNGFSKDDLLYIIENSESNLSLIDSFYWHEYLPDMATRINFVN